MVRRRGNIKNYVASDKTCPGQKQRIFIQSFCYDGLVAFTCKVLTPQLMHVTTSGEGFSGELGASVYPAVPRGTLKTAGHRC